MSFSPWRNFVDRVSAKLAFFPPTPPSYKLIKGTGEHGAEVVDFEVPLHFEHTVKELRTQPTRRGKCGGHEIIVAAYIPYSRPGAQRAQMTLLCSHGNAVDLGQMIPVYRELGRLLRVDIVGYDYAGYGCSTGTPAVSQTLSDIQAVFDWVVNDLGVPHNRVLLYGQSVGSGPTAWLAAHEKAVAGVVLHSPILSGVRVLNPGLSWWPAWADVFPNHTLVPKIQAPVLIIHGTEDEVISISCGKKLAELVKPDCLFPPLWAPGYNHQNIEACPDYLPTLLNFIAHAKSRSQRATASVPTA